MQTKAIKEGCQGHFGDKARIQNDLDKLDEMAPNTEVKHEPGTTAKCCASAGDTRLHIQGGRNGGTAVLPERRHRARVCHEISYGKARSLTALYRGPSTYTAKEIAVGGC